MELKEFIKTAITDITEAVGELQTTLSNGAIVNPTLPNGYEGSLAVGDDAVRVERLDFDVAVAVSDVSSTQGAAKAGISVIGAKIGAESQTRTENVSRLVFSIPVVYPAAHVISPQEKSDESFRREDERLAAMNRQMEAEGTF